MSAAPARDACAPRPSLINKEVGAYGLGAHLSGVFGVRPERGARYEQRISCFDAHTGSTVKVGMPDGFSASNAGASNIMTAAVKKCLAAAAS